MVEEIIKSRQPFRPLLALFHPKKQPMAQLPQLSQLLLQHLTDTGWEWAEGLKGGEAGPGASPASHSRPHTPALLIF